MRMAYDPSDPGSGSLDEDVLVRLGIGKNRFHTCQQSVGPVSGVSPRFIQLAKKTLPCAEALIKSHRPASFSRDRVEGVHQSGAGDKPGCGIYAYAVHGPSSFVPYILMFRLPELYRKQDACNHRSGQP